MNIFDSFFQDLGVEITNISHERINNIKTIVFNVNLYLQI